MSLFMALFALFGCKQENGLSKVDLILQNGTIYTVDSAFNTATCVAVNEGKIVAVGSPAELSQIYEGDTVIDLDGKFLYPGLIDAHCHFYGYGKTASELELYDVKSLDQLVEAVVEYDKANNPQIILGRGWNEENWTDSKEVNNERLNELFPDKLMVLQRVDGHSVLVNQAAFEAAGLKVGQEIPGGEIRMKNGVPTGVLVDAAAEITSIIIPEPKSDDMRRYANVAQEHCFKEGLTTVADAGLPLDVLKFLSSMADEDLKIRIYSMSNPGKAEMDYFNEHGPIYKPNFRVRSIKLYSDGSLGSSSAWLKKSYCGDEGNHGLPQADTVRFREVCETAAKLNFQLNTHCIGDSANAVMLRMYADYSSHELDRRWRIEHAQIVDPKDMHLFGDNAIIPSVQPTHAISDMFMAEDRLCGDMTGAYAYKSLLANAGILAFGTDFPVERISPMATFYTAVERKNNDGKLFLANEALSRENALRAMTIWAAYACFMENEVGSIEPGKYADFTLLDTDLIQDSELKNAKVLATFVGGEQVYRKP